MSTPSCRAASRRLCLATFTLLTALGLLVLIFYRWGASPDGPWAPAQQISTNPGRRSLEAAVACDSEGRVHVVWHDEAAGPSSWDIHYRRYENGQWQPEQRVSDRGDQDVFPTLAVGLDDQIHVTWCNYQTTAVYHRARTAQGVWSPTTRLDVGGARSLKPHVAVLGASDYLMVVWHDDAPGNWDIAFAYRAGGFWYGPYFFNQPGVTDAFAQVAWDPNTGHLAIIWMDYNNLYLCRYRGGDGFEPQRVLIPNYGCKDNALAIDPTTGMVHAVAQARKNGVTNNNSWDLLWACD